MWARRDPLCCTSEPNMNSEHRLDLSLYFTGLKIAKLHNEEFRTGMDTDLYIVRWELA
jgi:hypothetical protein